MIKPEIQEQAGMLQTVKDQMNINTVVDNIKQSKDTIIEVSIYTAVGFFVGYLVKRYSNFLAVLVMFIGVLVVLAKFEIVSVTINWDYVGAKIGIQPILLNSESASTLAWAWARANTLLLISALVGFLFGLKIG